MYYNVLPHHFVSTDPKDPRKNVWGRPYNRVLCYAESQDGIHWTKTNLGLCEWDGSRENNILLPNDDFEYVFSETDGPCVFIDPNARTPDEKYKMFIKVSPVSGKPQQSDEGPIPVRATKQLRKAQYAFASRDGIRWRLMSTKRANAGPKNDTADSVLGRSNRQVRTVLTTLAGRAGAGGLLPANPQGLPRTIQRVTSRARAVQRLSQLDTRESGS